MKSIKKSKHMLIRHLRGSRGSTKKIKQGNERKKNVLLHVLNKNFVALWKSNVSKRK
jgi:hypothetical protein